jgi:hypothetical protein
MTSLRLARRPPDAAAGVHRAVVCSKKQRDGERRSASKAEMRRKRADVSEKEEDVRVDTSSLVDRRTWQKRMRLYPRLFDICFPTNSFAFRLSFGHPGRVRGFLLLKAELVLWIRH